METTAIKNTRTVERVLRRREVMATMGWSNATLYKRIAEGRFPKPLKLDPNSRVSVWLESDIATIQAEAIARCGGQMKVA